MYSYYPEELIEEIRINNDIVDVVSEYVKLEKKGKDYFGLCPFHKEKTPSFSVVATKQIYYCFGCSKGGNVIHFIMNVENLDYVEAVKYLADRARMELPEGESKEEKEKAELRKEIIKINIEAARFFRDQLYSEQNRNVVTYLKNRKISEQMIRKFGIGYSPHDWDLLYKHLTGMGFRNEVILKSGLAQPAKNGGYCDRFRSRVIFPIFDIRGNVIGFGGRVMDDSMPKYMNSPETPVYNKGRNLYAMNFAKHSGVKNILIVEGYMDVITLHQAGITNSVASLGTALTESQGRLLKKYAEEIIISYDSDTAGQAAAMRGLDLLNEIGCNVKVLVIPDGKDPDEFIKKNGAEAFRSLIHKSITLVEYKIKVLKKQINTETIEGKIKLLNNAASVLAKVDNVVEREMYIRKIANEYEITEEALLAEVYKKIKPKSNFKSKGQDISNIGKIKQKDGNFDSELVQYERRLLAILCFDNSVYKAVKNKINVQDFTLEENKKIAEYVVERLSNNKGIVPGELLNILDEDYAKEFTRIIQEECNFEDNIKAILDIIKKIELFKIDKRQKEILKLLGHHEGLTGGDVENLKQELQMLLIKKKGL
ncbi:MAG: DNA primase [Clostridia bacterium]|nr:DNA primase [Clostridia bacterium]